MLIKSWVQPISDVTEVEGHIYMCAEIGLVKLCQCCLLPKSMVLLAYTHPDEVLDAVERLGRDK